MKKRHYTVIVLLLAALVLLILFHKKPDSSTQPSSAEVEPHTPTQMPNHIPESSRPSSSAVAPYSDAHTLTSKKGDEGAPVSQEVLRYVQNVRADPQYDWKQPINFYGKVVDESNQPVADADAHFSWTDLSVNGTSEANAESDANGMFSLIDRTGKRLSVTVSKSGYYSRSSARGSYEYANPADGLFTPDQSNPVVFHLRKKGVSVDLITSQFGMNSTFPISIPRDGTPVNLDVMRRQVGGNGQIQISEMKPEYSDWKKATEWSFKMEIPDGGFMKESDEFPFEAPEKGYQPTVEFKFQKDVNWTENLQKDYYIKFGTPARYGRLHIQTGISMGGAILTYAINPDGSRNLEPQ